MPPSRTACRTPAACCRPLDKRKQPPGPVWRLSPLPVNPMHLSFQKMRVRRQAQGPGSKQASSPGHCRTIVVARIGRGKAEVVLVRPLVTFQTASGSVTAIAPGGGGPVRQEDRTVGFVFEPGNAQSGAKFNARCRVELETGASPALRHDRSAVAPRYAARNGRRLTRGKAAIYCSGGPDHVVAFREAPAGVPGVRLEPSPVRAGGCGLIHRFEVTPRWGEGMGTSGRPASAAPTSP
jgi:hypothetical protein